MEKIKFFLYQHRFILLLTLIGAFLRFYRLEATLQFLGDQGRDALVWKKMLFDHDLPFIGPITSVGGFFLGPLYYYLMAPFYWIFGNSPIGPAYATALIGVLTIPALFFFTKQLFSVAVAKLAAFLYTFGAIPVTETRSAWNPNPMPLAALGIVYGFYQAQKTKQIKWLYLSALSLGIALQLHYMIVFLSPFILWQLFLAFKQPRLRRALLAWFCLIILLMLPLILFEIKNHFLNTLGLYKFLTQHRYGSINLSQNIYNLRGRSEEAIGMLLGFGRQTNFFRTWLSRLFLLGIFITWFKKPTKEFKLVSLWLLLSIAAVAFYKENIPPYYLAFLFPAVFILGGWLLNKLAKRLLIFRWLLVILFIILNAPVLYQTLTSTGNFKSAETTGRFIIKDVGVHNYQNYNLTLLDDTHDYKAMAFRYFVERFGGQPLGIADYPQAQVLYVISPYRQTDVLNEPIWEITSLLPAIVSAQWQFPASENIYKIERL